MSGTAQPLTDTGSKPLSTKLRLATLGAFDKLEHSGSEALNKLISRGENLEKQLTINPDSEKRKPRPELQAEKFFNWLGLATRQDLDEVHAELARLQRALKKVEKELKPAPKPKAKTRTRATTKKKAPAKKAAPTA